MTDSNNSKKKKMLSDCKPEFKPGNTPSTTFGNQVLNANVMWDQLILDLLESGYTYEQIATEAEIDVAKLKQIVHEKDENFPFRSGARLVTIHYRRCPSYYYE